MSTNQLLARLHQLLAAVMMQQPLPSRAMVLALTAAVLLVVLPVRPWRLLRHVITIFHEGGHAFMSILVGERRQRIHLNRDTSGYTQSSYVRGRPTHVLRSALTASAGYPATSVLGLAMALALTLGHATATLWLLLLILVVVLVQVRNFWGWFSVLATIACLGLVTWLLPNQFQTGLATAVTLIFLAGGLRTSLEQRASERQPGLKQGEGQSDARVLAQLLHLPLGFTLWFFILLTGACAVTAYVLLLGYGPWL